MARATDKHARDLDFTIEAPEAEEVMTMIESDSEDGKVVVISSRKQVSGRSQSNVTVIDLEAEEDRDRLQSDVTIALVDVEVVETKEDKAQYEADTEDCKVVIRSENLVPGRSQSNITTGLQAKEKTHEFESDVETEKVIYVIQKQPGKLQPDTTKDFEGDGAQDAVDLEDCKVVYNVNQSPQADIIIDLQTKEEISSAKQVPGTSKSNDFKDQKWKEEWARFEDDLERAKLAAERKRARLSNAKAQKTCVGPTVKEVPGSKQSDDNIDLADGHDPTGSDSKDATKDIKPKVKKPKCERKLKMDKPSKSLGKRITHQSNKCNIWACPNDMRDKAG